MKEDSMVTRRATVTGHTMLQVSQKQADSVRKRPHWFPKFDGMPSEFKVWILIPHILFLTSLCQPLEM